MQRIRDLIDIADPAWPSIAAVLREFSAAGIDLDEASVPMAVKLGRQRWAELDKPEPSHHSQLLLASGSESIVYYIRRAARIKIGTTSNPCQRFAELRPDEILAFEPGEYECERMRHRQFAHLRVTGEYFGDEPELRDHVASLLAMYGAPDPSWPTIATRDPAGWRPAMPATAETLTAAEAQAELGIKRTTVRAWYRLSRIQIAGLGADGAHSFNREQLIALRDSAREREIRGL